MPDPTLGAGDEKEKEWEQIGSLTWQNILAGGQDRY